MQHRIRLRGRVLTVFEHFDLAGPALGPPAVRRRQIGEDLDFHQETGQCVALALCERCVERLLEGVDALIEQGTGGGCSAELLVEYVLERCGIDGFTGGSLRFQLRERPGERG